MHYFLLDIYRYFAALIVCISHFIYNYNKSLHFEFTSILGVELFFILSGFVLAPQLLKLQDNIIKNLKIFLLRRWIRTIPPYLVALFCAAFLFGYGDYKNFLKFLTYTQNLISDSPSPNFFSVAWSLSVEEWFYIILPFLILITRYIKNKVIKLDVFTICLIIIIILNIVRPFYNSESVDWGIDIRRSVIFRIDSICFGVVAFILKDKISKIFLVVISLFSLIFLFYLLIDPKILLDYKILQNLFLLICAICFSSILILFTFKDTNLSIIKKISSFGANISYSMYLFHIFFIPFAINLFTNIIIALIGYLVLLKLFCFLFFIYFEKPLLKSRPKYE
tara:strand:+ start:455 stop:1462 length:1008 start_codon:yes stop_codon:yes gene_type:complete